MIRIFILSGILFPLAGLAQRPEAATPPLWVRLDTAVHSTNGASTATVRATVTAPYEVQPGIRIPVGSRITGRAEAVKPDRGRLRLVFDSVRIQGAEYPMRARVLQVDNARERITADGTILALDSLRRKPGKVELLLLAAAHAHPAALAFVEGSKLALREVEKPSVHYPAGTDLALQVERAPRLDPAAAGGLPAAPVATAAPADLAAVLQALPNRTETYQTHRPSDWVNVAFAGDRDDVTRAFELAGWKPADRLSVQADIKVFLALASHHAYQQAPVSRLSLAGRLPALVYQKQTNTFAKRHHIRIWAAGGRDWNGRQLWLAAATHDIGIEFSSSSRTFTHRIDPDVDRERDKVANDLLFAGVVRSDFFLRRPEIPAESRNATGDPVRSDGVLRVLVLSPR